MSVIAAPPDRVTGSTSGLYQFTVERYERMAAAGILTEDDRVELINGLVVTKKVLRSMLPRGGCRPPSATRASGGDTMIRSRCERT